MAQTKRKRQTKHRGTQAGTIESRGRTSRPSSRADARKRALQQKQSGSVQRANRPPSWTSASIRGSIAAAVFAVVLTVFKEPPASIAFISLLMLGLYIPLGYFTDQFLYKRRERKDAEARAAAVAEKATKKSG